MSESSVSPENILEFWFGKYSDDAEEAIRLFEIWFKPDPDYDNLIRDRFGKIVERAAAGEFNHWTETARGSLALILILDQMPRNIFRGNQYLNSIVFYIFFPEDANANSSILLLMQSAIYKCRKHQILFF